MGKDLIATQDLAIELGGRQIFNNVTFKVGVGEFIGLLGPNGAGKTTLLRTMLGLVSPQSGELQTSTSMAYVPQRHDVAWDFPITVQQMVVNGRVGLNGIRRATKADKASASRAIAQVGLDDLAPRPIEELSGGQRQRVLIARALATEPEVLLLDEPFTGLDAPNMEILSKFFQRLAKDGTSLIMSTHDLAHAAHSCSRLILFRGGIITDGPATKVVKDLSAWEEAFQVSADSPTLAVLKSL